MPMSPYYRALRERIGTELLLIPAVAAVLRDDQGRILVQRTRHATWSLPAGAMEPGESPARAVVREVYEETGLIARAERVLGVFGGPEYRVTYPNGDQVEALVTVFECKQLGGSLSGGNDETEFLQWFELDELPELAVSYPAQVLRGSLTATYFDWNDSWMMERA